MFVASITSSLTFFALPTELRVQLYKQIKQEINRASGSIAKYLGFILSCKKVKSEFVNVLSKGNAKRPRDLAKKWRQQLDN